MRRFSKTVTQTLFSESDEMILVTGANGQLGGDVCRILKDKGKAFLPTDTDTLDITDKESVETFFATHNIDAVIHCAAYTAVDKAEDNKELCFLVNETGTRNLSLCAESNHSKMLYVSTDYIFNGEGNETFETDSPKGPLNVYGQSKLKGELAVLENCKKAFIVRTSWVFGEKNTNFIATMLRLSETHNAVSVVCDQVGSPTYSKHLAKLICNMIETEKFGVYHATNEGFCSWAELAKEVFSVAGKTTKVNSVLSSDYKSKAKRPLNSRLSKTSLDNNGFERLPGWREAVKEYVLNIL